MPLQRAAKIRLIREIRCFLKITYVSVCECVSLERR